MTTPPGQDDQLPPAFAGLHLSAPRSIASSRRATYGPPDTPADKYLDGATIAIAYEQFLRGVIEDPPPSFVVVAFEFVVQTIRAPYVTALMVGEEVGKVRMRYMEDRFRESTDAFEKKHKESTDALEKKHQESIEVAAKNHMESTKALEKRHRESTDALEKKHQESNEAAAKGHRESIEVAVKKHQASKEVAEKGRQGSIEVLEKKHQRSTDILKKGYQAGTEVAQNKHWASTGVTGKKNQTRIEVAEKNQQESIEIAAKRHQDSVEVAEKKHQESTVVAEMMNREQMKAVALLHEAQISSAKVELALIERILQTKVDAAERRTEVLREELSLARHRYIASNLETSSTIQGSVTRRRRWQEAIKRGSRDQTLPILSVDGQITDEDVQALTQTCFADESRMYTPTTGLLVKLLNRPRTESDPGVKVFNTHNQAVLPPFKPDLSICLDGSSKADSTSIYLAIELKHVAKPIDDEAYGQALDDLLVMHACQPARSVFACLVSTLHDNHIILLRITDGRQQEVVHYSSVSLAIALTYIKQVVLSGSTYRPPVPSFSIQLQSMERRLGNQPNSVVAEFKMPESVVEKVTSQWPLDAAMLGTTMAVKVLVKHIPSANRTSDSHRIGTYDDLSQELMIYHLIQAAANPCKHLARLVYESDDGEEMGIAPVGKSIDLRGISDHFTLCTILRDVLQGITWLHKHGILHRDIRRDNIIVVSESDPGGRTILRGRIIDFGASISLEPGETHYQEQDYLGGYICCPQELIGAIRTPYTPLPEHDFLAWVMLVNSLVFPNGIPYLHSYRVGKPSMEADMLKQYWDRLTVSPIWGPFVKAAKEEKPEQLEIRLSHMIIML